MLVLGGVEHLNVGWIAPSEGIVYIGSDGRPLRDAVTRSREEAEMKVANIVVPACVKLKTLWIGDWRRVDVVRDDDGKVLSLGWNTIWRRYEPGSIFGGDARLPFINI